MASAMSRCWLVLLGGILTGLLLQVQQGLGQSIDYDVQDNGLGDSFQPSVKASCVGGTMSIRVDTKQPFEGIIHGPNRTEAGCSVLGEGSTKTFLNIDLTKAAGTPGSCGVKYNKVTEERSVAIAVRSHRTIELLDDRVYVITCRKPGFQNSRNEISIVQLKVTLPTDSTRKLDTVLEGKRYRLRAQVLDHDPAFDILVKRCFAFDETDTSLQLIDDRGCKDDRLISEFSYDSAAGTAEATIYSMFRLPHSNRTYFQCDVTICKDKCQRPQCGGDRRSTGQSTGELQPLPDKEGAQQDPFQRAEDDTVTTSTSVFVAQPGSEQSVNAIYCSGQGTGDWEWLRWLALALGILFAIMLLINIFLCSAMTCSCTKSEIIEKEPSVYDDYSIYESQYGYTNGKAYDGSESDYGSEYGSNRHEEPQLAHDEDLVRGRGGSQPDLMGGGTLRSQNFQDSTLTRSRHHQ